MEQKNLNRLRVIIAEKNLTNKWLSEQLGVGQATVSNWVQNNAQPNLEMLIKISKILNVDINELIRPDEVQMDVELIQTSRTLWMQGYSRRQWVNYQVKEYSKFWKKEDKYYEEKFYSIPVNDSSFGF